MKFKIRYFLLLITLATSQLLKAQPKEREAGSKGTYKTQGFSTVLSNNESVNVRHYELWYEGVKIISGDYSQEKQEGLWRHTNLTGDIFFQGNYLQNKKNGTWKYFLNQKPLCTIYYKNDKKDSTCKSFYENGKTQCIINYSNGLKNGAFKLFYDNGNIRSEAVYRNDTLIGNVITYYKNNIVKTSVEYHNSSPYNIIIMNDSLGRRISFGNFKNGAGSLKTYFEDGKIFSEENYENGLRNGKSTTYFSNGELNIKAEFKNNKPSGDWIYFNSTGKIISENNYKDAEAKKDTLTNKDESKLIDALIMNEKMPRFQGVDTEKEMMNFCKKNIIFPKSGNSGTVYVTFTVTNEGSLSDLNIIRGVTYDLNYEALRIVNKMPPWTPGFQNGFPVDVQYTLPINFSFVKVKRR